MSRRLEYTEPSKVFAEFLDDCVQAINEIVPGITLVDIRSDRKTRDIAKARRILCCVLRTVVQSSLSNRTSQRYPVVIKLNKLRDSCLPEFVPMSLPLIAAIVNKDHSSVHCAIERNWSWNNEYVRFVLNALRKKYGGKVLQTYIYKQGAKL